MVSPVRTEETQVKIFRLMHPTNAQHFYTNNRDAAMDKKEHGWVMENDLGFCREHEAPGWCPWFHLVGENGDHFYTTNKEESEHAKNADHYRYEGVVCHVGSPAGGC